jgi:hypothetical protein
MSEASLVLAGFVLGASILFLLDRFVFRSARKTPVVAPSWKQIRDVLIFVGGMAFAAHEVFLRSEAERPTILILAATMMGLPLVLRADEKREAANGGSSNASKAR